MIPDSGIVLFIYMKEFSMMRVPVALISMDLAWMSMSFQYTVERMT